MFNMIYSFIEKKILRHAILISHLFSNEMTEIETMAQILGVSTMTVRNDLLFLETYLSDYVQSIVTSNGRITMTLRKETHLEDLVFLLLKQSLVLKYLFITLFDVQVSLSELTIAESVSTTLARQVLKNVNECLHSEFAEFSLSDNQRELKTRMMIICLSQYIDLESMDELFDKTILNQSIQMARQFFNPNTISKQQMIQTVITFYLAIDRSLIHYFDIAIPDQTNHIYRQVQIVLKPFVEPDSLISESFFASLIVNLIHRPYIDDPLINAHPYIFQQLNNGSEAISQLALLLAKEVHLNRSDPIFQLALKQFLIFQWLDFPLQLTFYTTSLQQKQCDHLMNILMKWNQHYHVFPYINPCVIHYLAQYMILVGKMSRMYKTIFIVAPTIDLHYIYRHTIEEFFSDKFIMIDYTFYQSIHDIPLDIDNHHYIVVCDRSIQIQPTEYPMQLIYFSIQSIEQDLVRLHQCIHQLIQ